MYWLTLPMPRQESRRQQFLAINYAIAQAARKAGSKAHVVDTVPMLSPGNRFHRKLRYRGESVVVRDGDGVHLTTAGARMARDLVVRAMRSDGVLRRRPGGRHGGHGHARLREAAARARDRRGVRPRGRGRARQSSRIAVGEDGGGYTVIDRRARRCGPARVRGRDGAQPCAARRRAPPSDRSVFVDAAERHRPHRPARAAPPGPLAEVRGGGDADLIFGSAGDDFLSGGGGGDVLVGGTASTCSTAARATMSSPAAPGATRVTYQRRSQPVTVDLAEGTGGGRGERDRLLRPRERDRQHRGGRHPRDAAAPTRSWAARARRTTGSSGAPAPTG